MPGHPWSLDLVVSRLSGDEELARQMVILFIAECPRMLAAIHDALAAGSPDAVRRAAHAFKGSVGNFTDDTPTLTARSLEYAAADGRLDEAAALVDRLEREVDDLLRAMAEFA